MVAIFLSVVIMLYVLLVLIFWLGWEKAVPCIAAGSGFPVTIVVAVRNEEDNIRQLLADIRQQAYPHDLLELILVDDHSEDNTVAIIADFIAQAGAISCQLIKLTSGTGKKKALAAAIDRAHHELILTTDGDCRLPPNWVGRMVACFANDSVQLVSGPVRMMPRETFWQRLQAIEFSSLISAGAATLTLGWPTMANAANLAFRKTAYKAVLPGQPGQQTRVSSGDDVFLLHGIHRQFKQAIVFCRDQEAIVDTGPAKNLPAFYQQRKRWSGKWQFYRDVPTQLLAVFIFLVNLVVVALPVLVFFGWLTWVSAVNLLLIKIVFEYFYLREVQKFFKTKFLLFEFVILALGYPLYVILMAMAGFMGNYNWKGRTTR